MRSMMRCDWNRALASRQENPVRIIERASRRNDLVDILARKGQQIGDLSPKGSMTVSVSRRGERERGFPTAEGSVSHSLRASVSAEWTLPFRPTARPLYCRASDASPWRAALRRGYLPALRASGQSSARRFARSASRKSSSRSMRRRPSSASCPERNSASMVSRCRRISSSFDVVVQICKPRVIVVGRRFCARYETSDVDVECARARSPHR